MMHELMEIDSTRELQCCRISADYSLQPKKQNRLILFSGNNWNRQRSRSVEPWDPGWLEKWRPSDLRSAEHSSAATLALTPPGQSWRFSLAIVASPVRAATLLRPRGRAEGWRRKFQSAVPQF